MYVIAESNIITISRIIQTSTDAARDEAVQQITQLNYLDYKISYS